MSYVQPVSLMIELETLKALLIFSRMVSEDHTSLVNEKFKAHDAATHRRLSRELKTSSQLGSLVDTIEKDFFCNGELNA